MKQSEADAIFEKAKEDQVILEPWDQPSGEIRLVDLRAILRSLVVEGEYGYLADEIERRILAMFDNEEPHKFYDDTVLPFIREQLGSKKAVRLKKETDKEISLRKWEEYEQWLSEWNGDCPSEREHATFPDWLKERK